MISHLADLFATEYCDKKGGSHTLTLRLVKKVRASHMRDGGEIDLQNQHCKVLMFRVET